ncbi:MAG TPA: Mrp/NBP35 family ATP-binding protein [Chthonomonadales bacterium]|nr:Mrp/NBP35 family ATP-binding protein [Chthonomonadales bacterium]
MPDVHESQILEALRSVQDPDLHRDIVSLGFVKDVRIDGGRVEFRVELTTPACPMKDQLREQAHAAVAAIEGVEEVSVEMTARVRTPQRMGPLIPGVKHVVAVASGKGGVGKSTVSVNLAVALVQTGASVGLLDADIYGPTIPIMMGTDEAPDADGDQILPVERYGVKLMSMGFFLEPDRAVVWRGPMIGKFLQQVLQDVRWGELDYLVIDLPPGTGDAPMSLVQIIPLTGVVIVTTPQDVAQEIATKAVLMFRTLEQSIERPIPILGIVENMSGFVCPSCGEETDLFGTGGGERAALNLKLPLLGSVPIDPSICLSGDAGRPSILMAPDSPQASAFRRIAGAVAARASIAAHADAPASGS